MKITVINGTEKHGVTWHLKEIFLEPFQGKAEITEFSLPRDCPSFCSGCTSCLFKGEQTCKDALYVQKIDQALRKSDLIVMTSPAYVMHTTGAMKTLLDHLAYLWIPHRPARELFEKRAIIITQCLGSGARSAAKDIQHSLSWWGISDIRIFTGKLMSEILWDQLPEKKRVELTKGIRRLSAKMARIRYDQLPQISQAVKLKFFFVRMMQTSLYENDPEYLDAKYWAEQGWLEDIRPWKGNQ